VKFVRNEPSADMPLTSNIGLGIRANFLSSLHWDGLARVASIVLTTTTIIALARGLGPLEFAEFQITLTLAGYILWVGDFGLLTRMTNLSGAGKSEELKKAWNLRITNTFIATVVFFMILTVLSNSLSPLIAMALVVDGFVDANYNLRMLTSKNSTALFFQPFRKASQSSIIILVLLSDIKLSESVIFLAFFLPSFCLLIWDIKKMGGFHLDFSLSYLKTTFGYFFQGGSTYLANCDYLILAHSGNSALVTLVALPRRIVNSISLLGTLTNPRIQNDVARQKRISKAHWATMSFTTLVGLFLSILFSFNAEKIFIFLFGFNLSEENILLVILVILSAPIQMLVVAINSLYFGLEAPKYPVIASYLGSVTYILLLGIVVKCNISIVLSLGILIGARLIVELIYLLVKLPSLVRMMT
jgi:O-antigen/teichoic acid export membrane protein